jgi:hypothetical protein
VKKKRDYEPSDATMLLMSSGVQHSKLSCLIYKNVTGKKQTLCKTVVCNVYGKTESL